MLVLITMGLFSLCVVYAIAEAVIEKDWPRGMLRYVLLFGVLLLVAALDP